MHKIDEVAAQQPHDHRIVLYYEVDGLKPSDGPSARTISAIANIPNLPEDVRPAMRGRYGSEVVWERTTDKAAGDDFYDHIRDLVAGTRPELMARWTLAECALRLINYCDLREESADSEIAPSKRLILRFSKSAKDRMSAAGVATKAIAVSICEAHAYLFGTGHGFLAVHVEFSRPEGGTPTAIEILEGKAALGRINTVIWASRMDSQESFGEDFTLGTLIRAICLGAATRTRASGRVAAYAYVLFDNQLPLKARDAYAIHLARSYTTDYELDEEPGGLSNVRDFTTVRHVASQEGVATVIGAGEGEVLPEFLLEYKQTTLLRHYALIFLLCLHERSFVIDRTTRSIDPAAKESDSDAAIALLVGLRESVTVFRLFFRFPALSQISMHNELHAALRSAFALDRMTECLDESVTDAAERLKELRHATTQRQFQWATLVGGSSIAALTAFTILKEFIHVFTHNETSAGWAGVIAGVITFAVTFFVSWRRSRKEHAAEHHHGHDLGAHAMRELMIKRALK
jgi:uncharacterized membrane protein